MSTIDERREALETDGYPVCPGCHSVMERATFGAPLRTAGWTPRICPMCRRWWRVEVRDEGRTRRVIGYDQRGEDEGVPPMGGEIMSAKSKPKKSSSKKQGHQHEEKPVELLIDSEGIHSLTAGAKPTLATPAAVKKAKATQAEAPQQPDDGAELVVFAFRLTRAERDAIHAAAGSAKASSFVRGLALAAARQDGEAIQRILTEIQAGR